MADPQESSLPDDIADGASNLIYKYGKNLSGRQI
jgi:hypothetical protein